VYVIFAFFHFISITSNNSKTNLNRKYDVCSCLSQSSDILVKTEFMDLYDRACRDAYW